MSFSTDQMNTAVTSESILPKTFGILAVNLGICAISSFFTLNFHPGMGFIILSFILSIGLIFAIHSLRDSASAIYLLGAFCAVSGISAGPTIGYYLETPSGAAAVTTALAATAVSTLALCGYAIVSKRNFSHWGGFLITGLVSLIVVSILNLFFQSSLLSLTLSAVGALIFSMYIVYDTSQIIHGGVTNPVLAALSLFLDILNLFYSLLRLFGSRD